MATRVDAHHHLWDLAIRPQPWIDAEVMGGINRTFHVRELLELTTTAGIDHTVLVEAAGLAVETQELLAIATHEPLVSGVVGFLDLSSPSVSDEIDRMADSAGGDRLVGVRSHVQDEPDPRWLTRDDVLTGLRVLASRGLTYDLLIVPAQLEAAAAAVAAVPDGRFVVDHLAKPPIRSGAWEPWASGIAKLASFEHVACKLSGMVTEADWRRWRVDDLRRYSEHVLSLFGPERVIFGSDWPVCLLAGTYAEVATATDDLLSDLTANEQAAVLGENATSWYRLAHRERK